MLRKNAAEAVKREQERKANERREIVAKRIGEPTSLDNQSVGMYLIELLNCNFFSKLI